jgi:hypothetical protein
VFGLAERAGVSWGAFVDQDGYPAKLIQELSDAPMQANVHGPGSFLQMLQAGTTPRLSYVWSPQGYDEHPPFGTNPDPNYVAKGHDLKWQEIQGIVDAGLWSDTTCLLTYDDWGGYADHVPTPSIETLPDALHPDGFQAIGGSRLPLIIFGGHVVQGIDNRWHSHASIMKTITDLIDLPPLGVPRVDSAPSMADRVDPNIERPPPPAYGSEITQPTPPSPQPVPQPPEPWPAPLDQPMPPLVTNDGSTLPAPTDGVVYKTPPRPPRP